MCIGVMEWLEGPIGFDWETVSKCVSVWWSDGKVHVHIRKNIREMERYNVRTGGGIVHVRKQVW